MVYSGLVFHGGGLGSVTGSEKEEIKGETDRQAWQGGGRAGWQWKVDGSVMEW